VLYDKKVKLIYNGMPRPTFECGQILEGEITTTTIIDNDISAGRGDPT